MLQKVGFQNFLALRNVELTLEPFTVIVGPNASGKSSILEGIQRISYLRQSPIDFFGVDYSSGNFDEAWKLLESKNQTPEPLNFSFQILNNDFIEISIQASRKNYDAFINKKMYEDSQNIFDSRNFAPLKSYFITSN